MKDMIKTYSELVNLRTFEDRFEYLKLNGAVGEDTFGFSRYLNQQFYRSQEWKRIRDAVIVRDGCCDLGVEGYEIFGKVLIHHMNPLTIKDIEMKSPLLIDQEYLICVTHDTHNAIHYGDKDLLVRETPIIRVQNDTCPWRH